MLASERMASAVAVGGVVAEVSRVVEGIQRSLWRRCLRAVGLTGTPVDSLHRLHLTGTHLAIRGSARAAAYVTGTALAATASPDASSMADSTGGAVTQTAIASFYADQLHPVLQPLAPTMSVRVDRRAVALEPSAIAAAFPAAGPRLAIFLHGLMATERGWGDDAGFGRRLQTDHGFTPVHIRYNAGSHIPENGRRLSDFLERLLAVWPVAVERVILLGHSMGGLIIRSACAVAAESAQGWTATVDACFYLGAPNHGASLERGVARVAELLGATSNRNANNVARLLNQRSHGIKDLRYGSIVECEYDDADPHRRELDDHLDIPLHPDMEHHFIAATLLPDAVGRAANFIGDGMVSPVSATGSRPSGRRQPFAGARRHYLHPMPHARLPMDERVYEVIDRAIKASV